MLLKILRVVSLLIAVHIGSICTAQTISITGTVVDNSTSQGIGGATVKLLEFPSITATTAANGSFAIVGTSALPGPGPSSRQQTGISSIRIGDFFNASKSYSVVISHNGSRYLASGAKLEGTQNRLVNIQSDNHGVLAKVNTTYTLRVTASGYVLKDTILANTSANAGTLRLAAESEQTGVWTNVTPPAMGVDGSGFGPGSIAGDPSRPSDMYVGGSQSGLWKTTDYGNTWAEINSTSPDVPRGTVIAVAGTTPATIWLAGFNIIYKSINGGQTFTSKSLNYALYSLVVDPYDGNHLLSGLHETDGIVESVDGGDTWNMVGSTGIPSGGMSWYPFFVNTGDAATTRQMWVAIGQGGQCGLCRTTNGGSSWSVGVSGLEHPHGNAALFQNGSNLFMAGLYGTGQVGQGVFRSTNFGATWTNVDGGGKTEGIVWGTPKNVYAMYAWACGGCNLETNFEMSSVPGTSWTSANVPSGLVIGPNSIAVANNGSHYVFVGLMWADGLWRYVEP